MKNLILLLLVFFAFTTTTAFAQTKTNKKQQQYQCTQKDLDLTWVMFTMGADYLYYRTKDPFYWLYIDYKGKELVKKHCHKNLSVDEAVNILIKERQKYIQELEKPDV